MNEFYHQTKESALRALGSVLHQPVEDDHEAVHSALAAVRKPGRADTPLPTKQPTPKGQRR